MERLQLTLAILKPHILKQPPFLEEIRNIILTSNFKIVESQRQQLSLKDAETFYKEHQNKFFYKRLVTFMTSGPCDFYILGRENAIKKWREIMGPTKVFRTQFEAPNSIRGKFGLSDTRNATHGSDSEESAKKEIGIFFPYFDIEKWYQMYEEKFRLNQVKFNSKKFTHEVSQP